jgi:hypothetical protein
MSRKETPLVMPGNVLREYSKEQATDLASQWLEIFGKKRQGANAKAYMWHIFSAGRYPCLEGAEAETVFKEQVAPEYVVLSNSRDLAFVTDALPESCSLSDFLVFPPNFAWTMAFTHEAGWLGPYFAKHEQYATLNSDNQAKIRKAKEAELANLKGWR